MRIKNVRSITLPGFAGVREDLDPSGWDPRKGGVLDTAFNLVPVNGNKLAVRGGSAVKRTLTQGAISQVLGIFPFSPTGALMFAYSASGQKHYAYALTDRGEWALPTSSPTELGSRVSLGTDWATATVGNPQGEELFETFYVDDASDLNRRPLVTLKVTGGALVAATPIYDLDGTGGNDAPMKPYCLASFASHVFVAGYDSEAADPAPHLVRHSFLGVDPGTLPGFDPDAYALFGAQGQPVRAMAPGNTLLMAAKENELYRITGSGRALPGWQFAYQQLDNTLGLGVAHAHALCHVLGKWYGSGRGGPFISDGTIVESIVPTRRRSWASVDQLSVAFVKPHPDRNLILFGFHVAGSPSRPNFPFELWAWDLVGGRWAPTQRYPQTFHFVGAIAADVSSGPTTLPSALAQMFDYGEFEFSAITGRFSSGDLTASTEVWTREADGASTLATTLPPGIQRFRVTAATSRLTFVKLRHTKGIAVSEFSGETPMWSRLVAPEVKVGTPVNDGLVRSDFQTFVPNTDLLTFDTYRNEVDYLNRPAGFTTEFDLDNTACYTFIAPDLGALYSAKSRDLTWPVGHTESAEVECHTYAHKCTGDISTYAPEPRQRLERGGMALTSIAVVFFPARNSQQLRVDYRESGTVVWTAGPTVTSSATALDLMEVSLTGLNHSLQYDVAIVNVASGARSSVVVMYTKLAPVTALVAHTAGSPGSPVTDLTVTPAISGHSLLLYNALETYVALYANVLGVATYQSLAGVCGAADRYFARTANAAWPDGFDFSEAVTVDIDDPCLVA